MSGQISVCADIGQRSFPGYVACLIYSGFGGALRNTVDDINPA